MTPLKLNTITTKQLDFIESLQEQLEYQKYTVLNIASEIVGKRVQHYSDLDIKQASELIRQLLELKG